MYTIVSDGGIFVWMTQQTFLVCEILDIVLSYSFQASYIDKMSAVSQTTFYRVKKYESRFKFH